MKKIPISFTMNKNTNTLIESMTLEIESLREQNEYLRSVVESLLVEARQAKHGIEDMYKHDR